MGIMDHNAHWASGSVKGGITLRSHTFSAFWLRSSVVSVLNSLISVMCSMSTTLINRIFKPSPASLACKMLGRGAPTAVPGVAAGGHNKHVQHPGWYREPCQHALYRSGYFRSNKSFAFY